MHENHKVSELHFFIIYVQQLEMIWWFILYFFLFVLFIYTLQVQALLQHYD